MTENLWGLEKIDASPDIAPKAILAGQAAILEKLTNGLVYGTVETIVKAEKFVNTLSVFAPALDGYKFAIATVFHNIFMYPCIVMSEYTPSASAGFPDQLECADEQGLTEALRIILTNEKLIARIRALVAQSKAA